MPIMIKYLGAEQFGIWATMLTLITWVMLFDFGIGNGLKINLVKHWQTSILSHTIEKSGKENHLK